MKNVAFALAKAYFTLLQGLAYGSYPVAVYAGIAKDDAVAPYVIIGPWQPQSDNTKSSFGQKGELNLDIVTRFAGDLLSKQPAYAIADQITSLLKPTPTAEVLNVEGFNCYCTVVTSTQELLPPSNTDKIFRVIVTISHQLEQV